MNYNYVQTKELSDKEKKSYTTHTITYNPTGIKGFKMR